MSLGVPGNPTDPWMIFEPNKAFSDIQILMSMMGSHSRSMQIRVGPG